MILEEFFILFNLIDIYIDILKVNGREKEIEIIIAETPKIEEAFNKLYQIVINGNYKFD